MKIIQFPLGKKKLELVSGLVWHPLLNQPGGARRKEILDIAKQASSELMVKRGSDEQHIGFGKKSQGAKPGQISMAAAIADYIKDTFKSGNFLIALKVPDQADLYVYIAAHGGVILADGDISGTAASIRTRLNGDSAYEPWETIVCPDDWGINNSVEVSFSDIFNSQTLKKKKRWSLSSVSVSVSKIVFPLLLAIVVVGAAFGALKYKERQDMLARQAAEAEEAQRLAQQAIAAGKIPIAQTPPPWLNMATADAYVEACANARSRVSFNGGNWVFKAATCESGQFAVQWSRPNEAAWISHLIAIQPGAIIAPEADSATLRVDAAPKVQTRQDESIPVYQAAALYYLDQSSRLGYAVRLSSLETPPIPVLLPNQPPAQPVVAPPWWGSFKFTILTRMDPSQTVSTLSAPGMRVQKIIYSSKDGIEQYEISGVQYVKP